MRLRMSAVAVDVRVLGRLAIRGRSRAVGRLLLFLLCVLLRLQRGGGLDNVHGDLACNEL